jgi:Peptidase family C25/Secretion system C-terminal sorting domain
MMHGLRAALGMMILLLVLISGVFATALQEQSAVRWESIQSDETGVRARLAVQSFSVMSDEMGEYVNVPGMLPTDSPIPVITTFVNAPNGVGVVASVTASDYVGTGVYAPELAGTMESVIVGDPALFRGIRMFPVTLAPARVAEDGEILLANNIDMDVTFEGEDNRADGSVDEIRISAEVERYIRSMLLNLDEVNLNVVAPVGRLLVVVENNATLELRIEPYVQWKRQQGYEVIVDHPTSTTSSTAIFTLINSYYNDGSELPLDYVLLIGDHNGSVDMVAYSSLTDHWYTQLEGGDILGDVAIGRFSVQDAASELARVVNKTIAYERDVYMNNTAWLENAVLTSGTSSGISTIITNRSIKQMLNLNGVSSDTLWYTMGGDIPQFIVDNVNSGACFVNYRGWLGMSGWSTTDLNNMSNGSRLPVVVTITCGTGDFANTTTEITEGFFRAGAGANEFWGGVASIGTATSSTHTRFNNIVDGGIFEGMLLRNIKSLGWSLVNGKRRLYEAYIGTDDSGDIQNFTYWNNLMGDPALRVWAGVPDQVSVTHESTIQSGQNYLDVDVNHPGDWPELIWATLANEDEVLSTHRIDASGSVRLPFDPDLVAGTMKLTVVGDDVVPYQDDITINTVANYVYVAATAVNDGAGDDDQANPGETVALNLTMRNGGSSSVGAQVATVTTSSPYLSISGGNTFNVPALNAGASTTVSSAVQVQVDPFTPNGAQPELTVTVGATQDSDAHLDIIGFTASIGSLDLDIGGNGQLDVNESASLAFPFNNLGDGAATGLTGTLTTTNPHVTITDGTASYPSVAAGGTSTNSADPFVVTVSNSSYNGDPIDFKLTITDNDGGMDTTVYRAYVGDPANNGVTGPDDYGYWAVDNTDVSFGAVPIYSWSNIASPGNLLNVTDTSNEDDDALAVTLPFGFVYYGEVFNQITVSSNGTAAFGDSHTMYTFRNWPIPNPLGPPAMLAVNWEDHLTSGGGVYAYHDNANGRYIIQWNVQTRNTGASQVFQVVLFDPQIFPTQTGNGMIQFQYQTFSQEPGIYYDNDYCTVGIESPDQSTGLQYLYWTMYDNDAASINGTRAILFTDDLSGGGGVDPEAQIGPANIDVSYVDQIVYDYVDIENVGQEGTLVWSITETDNEILGPARRAGLGLPEYPEVDQPSTEEFNLREYNKQKQIDLAQPEARDAQGEGTGSDPVIDDLGGPDAFGYQWIDSNEPDGPAYSWHTNYGTALNSGDIVSGSMDDGYFGGESLGFSFDFYGATYSSVYINTNGFLTFQSNQTGSSTYGNRVLPGNDAPRSGQPASMLAGFWDDLNPGDGGTIYFYTNNNNLAVITFFDIPGYGGNGLYRFQMQIHGNGQVYFMYNSMGNTDITNATIGIQNDTGSIGLTSIYNGTYVENDLAILYYTSTVWFEALDNIGLLTPGQSTQAQIAFDGEGLPDGVYEGALNVSTNDQDLPLVVIPVAMYVGIQPPVVTDIPDQSIDQGQSFNQINLDNYVSDPNFNDNQLSWAATGQTDLSVSIVNRVATITPPNPQWSGVETITFTATNPSNGSDSDDATFSIGAGSVDIPFAGGRFELMSFPLDIPSLDVEDAFAGMTNLIVALNDDGDIYAPGQGTNTMGTVDLTEGYRVYTNTAQDFTITGTELDPNTLYSVSSGQWNWVGTPFTSPVNAVTAFSPIVNNLYIVVNDNGQIYWPNLGINTIGDLTPGDGYQIYVATNLNFVYNGGAVLASLPDHSNMISELPVGPNAPAPTGKPYAIHVALHEDLANMGVDVVEILDGSTVVGSGYLLPDLQEAVVISWQGDEEAEIAGFSAGNELKVRLLNESGSTIKTEIVGETSAFGEGSHASITVRSAELPVEFTVSAGYPNPFNPTITIPYALPQAGKVTFAVYNIIGQQVFAETQQADAGHHKFLYRPEHGMSSGVYFLQVQYGRQLNRQKIMLLK